MEKMAKLLKEYTFGDFGVFLFEKMVGIILNRALIPLWGICRSHCFA